MTAAERLAPLAPVWGWCRLQGAATVRYATGFAREHAPESSTRLCMLMLCVTGCYCALRIVDFAFAHPAEHFTIAALVSLIGALIASGVVAIALRTRSADSAAAIAAAAATDPTAPTAPTTTTEKPE